MCNNMCGFVETARNECGTFRNFYSTSIKGWTSVAQFTGPTVSSQNTLEILGKSERLEGVGMEAPLHALTFIKLFQPQQPIADFISSNDKPQQAP